jgi:carbonyl reductase 1
MGSTLVRPQYGRCGLRDLHSRIVVNNAAVALDAPPKANEITPSALANQTIDWNYTGTLIATQSLLPLIRDGGRLVNVSSTGGILSGIPSSALQERFRSASTIKEVSDLMEEYKSAATEGKTKQQGWPDRAYGVSKCGLTIVTNVIADQVKSTGSKTLINSCCPGLVAVRAHTIRK